MRALFYAGACLLAVFEAANVYFIMPLPFSQRMRSVELAYALYSWRWLFRAAFGILMLAGLRAAWGSPGWRRRVAGAALGLAGLVAYATNVQMSADRIFLAPTSVTLAPAEQNTVEDARLVVGIEINGDARAYPVQFIGYHHQV